MLLDACSHKKPENSFKWRTLSFKLVCEVVILVLHFDSVRKKIKITQNQK